MIRLTVDLKHDVAYLALHDGGVSKDTREIAPDVVVDFDAEGMPIGIEFLSAHRVLGNAPYGAQVEVQTEEPAAAQA